MIIAMIYNLAIDLPKIVINKSINKNEIIFVILKKDQKNENIKRNNIRFRI